MSDIKPTKPLPGIQSVDRTFEIMRALLSGGEALRLTDIARATGLARNHVHAYLVSLQRVGAVFQDPETGRYDLGETALQLGLAALSRMDFLVTARRFMLDLQKEVGESVWLSVWSDRGPVVVAKVESATASPFEIRIGTLVSVTTTATGRTFLAHLDSALWKPLVTKERLRLPHAPTDAELDAFLKQAKRLGVTDRPEVVISRDVVLRQFASLASPVFDHTGSIKAVLTVIGQTGVFDASVVGANASAVKSAAVRLSARLGYPAKAAA
jgi:DNA-binding IclR family transcriptional regulator